MFWIFCEASARGPVYRSFKRKGRFMSGVNRACRRPCVAAADAISRASFKASISGRPHGDVHFTDAVDPAIEDVTRFYGCNALWRARHEHVARLERIRFGCVSDQLPAVEDQIAGVGLLARSPPILSSKSTSEGSPNSSAVTSQGPKTVNVSRDLR